MLRPSAYRLLVVSCPLITLIAGLSLMAYQPAFAWHIAAVIALLLAPLLYFLRPEPAESRVQQFATAYAHAPWGVLILGLEGRVEWVNEAFEEALNQDSTNLTGQQFPEIMTGDAWQTIQTQRRYLLEGKRIPLTGCVNLDGETAVLQGSASLLRNDGNLPENIVIQFSDLSPPKIEQPPEPSESVNYSDILDLATDLVFMLDEVGRIQHSNINAKRVLTGNEQGVGLNNRNIIEFIDSTDQAEFLQIYKACTQLGESVYEIPSLKLLPASGQPQHLARTVEAKLRRLPGTAAGVVVVCHDRTEIGASIDELRDSDERFSRIFHSSPDAILIVRQKDSTIIDFNASFSRLLGYKREDGIGNLEVELNLFEDPGERKRLVHLLEETSECTNVETRLLTVSGEPVAVEISLRYVEINGELCTLCIGRDISKRLRAEMAQRESEEKFEQIFTQSPDGIVILDQKDLTICEINEAFLRASGYAREELMGESIINIAAVVNDEELSQATELITGTGKFANREMTFRAKSGEHIPAIVSATLIDLKGVRSVLCIAKDVRELRNTEDQLESSESRFRSAFENAPIGIMLFHTDGKIFQANDFATELLTFGTSSLEGTHITRLIPNEDRQQFKQSVLDLISGDNETERMERRLVCSDGVEIWTNFHIVLQRSSDGEPLYCIAQIADITEMKDSQERMERMAFYDTLTDLANRRLFYDRLAQAIEHSRRNGTLAALLYLDLDQFKRVNDTLGHEIGDVLLQEIAARLSDCVRKEDTVGRPGGDEFTILLYDIRTPTDASLVAEKILQRLRQPLDISGHQLVITPSVGIAIIPEDGMEPSLLMKNSDLAMYRAKENGRNNYQFYSEEMNTDAVTRLRTEYELRRALENHEFELYYQPKIRLLDQKMVGVECLIRWQHPERGLLGPIEFIDVAEETGAIVEIGTWIIEEACAAGRSLCEHAGTDVQIAINISPRQFRDPNLVATIRRSMRETGLNPNNVEIEITETMLMGDIEAANETVHRLHDLGVGLAIDDFGTGYSSLSYLKKFPIDTVKVDRSFVMDIPESSDDKAITSAVIAMAHRLNMQVVAEGVETKDQLEFLLRHDCDFAQGYLFSKPQSLNSILPMFTPNVRLLHGQ